MGRGRWGAIVLGGALLAASCGDDGGDSSSSAPERQGGPSGAVATQDAGPTTAGATTAATGSTTPLTAGTDIVYTGSVDVRVAEVDAATRDAQQKVTAVGGYLFSQRSSVTDGAPSATLVFKVPPGQFLPTIDSLGSLGTEVARNIQADDVSAQVVDLEARLASARVSLARTQEFLARANNVTDLVAVEVELTKRSTAVEQLQAQLNLVRSQVSAATITLTVGEKLKDAKPSPSKNIPGVLEGLRAGAVAFYNTLRVVLLVLFALLPWLPAVALIWYVVRRVNRRLAPRRAQRDARLNAAAAPLFVPYRPAPRTPPPPSGPRGAQQPASPAPDAASPPAEEDDAPTASEIADPPNGEPAEEEPAD